MNVLIDNNTLYHVTSFGTNRGNFITNRVFFF